MNYDNIEGVWIPREIWFNADLSLHEKIVFTQIKSLDRTKEGCTAGNSYFGKFMNLSESRISEIIKSLCDKKFVKSKIIQHQTTTGIKTQRYLKSCVKLGIVKDPFQIENESNLSLISSSGSRSIPSEKRNGPSESRITPSENAKYINIYNNISNSKDAVPSVTDEFNEIVKYVFDTLKEKSVNTKLWNSKPFFGNIKQLLNTHGKETIIRLWNNYLLDKFSKSRAYTWTFFQSNLAQWDKQSPSQQEPQKALTSEEYFEKKRRSEQC